MNKRKPKHRNRGERSRPLTRKTPLKAKKGLKKTPLARKLPPPESTFARTLPHLWKPLWIRWRAAVCRGRVCVMCGGHRGHCDPHHVLPARFIRRYMWSMRKDFPRDIYMEMLGRFLYDPRNGIPLCRDCHEAHEKGIRKVPREKLPESVWRFADELRMVWRVERLYPSRSDDSAAFGPAAVEVPEPPAAEQ